ncbi:hypothetical protein HK102_005874, partial [Quaeritorhiza haematococci]
MTWHQRSPATAMTTYTSYSAALLQFILVFLAQSTSSITPSFAHPHPYPQPPTNTNNDGAPVTDVKTSGITPVTEESRGTGLGTGFWLLSVAGGVFIVAVGVFVYHRRQQQQQRQSQNRGVSASSTRTADRIALNQIFSSSSLNTKLNQSPSKSTTPPPPYSPTTATPPSLRRKPSATLETEESAHLKSYLQAQVFHSRYPPPTASSLTDEELEGLRGRVEREGYAAWMLESLVNPDQNVRDDDEDGGFVVTSTVVGETFSLSVDASYGVDDITQGSSRRFTTLLSKIPLFSDSNG